MSESNQIKVLRNALAKARPFVAGIAELPTGYGLSAQKAIAVVDDALIRTDPDPIVRDILSQ